MWWRMLVGVPVVLGTVVVAFGAFPLGVWVGWRVTSGGWWWVDGADPVRLWRVVAGVLVGGLVFRFGLVLRARLVREWRDSLGSADRG
jgi:hypothetical protein